MSATPVQMECCIEGCDSKYGHIAVTFHRFPPASPRDAMRRQLWAAAAGLANNKFIIDNALICGRHFEKGKPSLPTEIGSTDWVPTLNLKVKPVYSLEPLSNAPSAMQAMNVITPQRQYSATVPVMGPQVIPNDFNLPAYCRLCLAEDVQMVFPKEPKVYQQLADKIKECLNLEISISELTNSLICKKCYETLEQMHQFRTRCSRQNTYLTMRKSLEPDRNQLLRYKDNWYWYSCLGNGMNSIIWGCSVVCCPAFIVSHPTGRICSRYANHQHKQKMDDVKAVYCHGEYIYDGYRYSFEVINANRTLTFSCRSLIDPYRACPAQLVTNDRSEVLSVNGVHTHEREVIIESAVKDGVDNAKRSITLIRSTTREIVFCQGYWYTTISEHSSISHWNCIRYDCISKITMVNGVVRFFGIHTHLPVFLKWGADEDKTMEPKGPTLMKVVNPPSSKVLPTRVVPPVASRESTTIVHAKHSTIVSTATINQPDENSLPIVVTSTSEDGSSLVSTIKVEPSDLTNVSTTPLSSTTTVRPPHTIAVLPTQPLVVSAAAISSKVANIPKVFVRQNHPIQVLKRMPPTTVRVVPPPPLIPPPKPAPKPIPISGPATVPKIVHVMSLNLNQPKPVPKVTVEQLMAQTEPDESQESVEIKEEPLDEPSDEPETITDEIQPAMMPPDVARKVELPKPPPLTPRPMLLVSSASVVSDNTLSVTTLDAACVDNTMGTAPDGSTVASSGSGMSQDTVSAEENEEDGLHDLQDDEEIPPIVPIDADLDQRLLGQEYSTKILPNGKTQIVRKVILSRGSATKWAGIPRVVKPIQTARLPVRNMGQVNKSTVAYAPAIAAVSQNNSVSVTFSRDKPTKMYGPSSGAQKRIDAIVELNNSAIKTTKPTVPLKTTIVDTEKYMEHDALEPTEDPIAVSMEPHQNVHSEDDDGENEDEGEERSASSVPASPQGNENENPVDEETLTSNAPPADPEKADPLVPQQTTPVRSQSPPDPSESQSDKKAPSKTVQLVKLQKTEQMLNHEGHLYKIKWHNRNRIYWDCMLREQVNCMAILETQSTNSRFWIKIGSHNHKVPKPIINDDNRGRYQMLTNDIAVASVKTIPAQTLSADAIEEQEGRMMHLTKRRMMNFKVRKAPEQSNKLTLQFANYEYGIMSVANPGFRWRCIKCHTILETDEKFTIAHEQGLAGIAHNHEPELPVINLVDEGTAGDAGNSKTSDTSETGDTSQQHSPQPKTASDDVDATGSGDQVTAVDAASSAAEPTNQADSEQEVAKSDEPLESEKEGATSKPDNDKEGDPSNGEEKSTAHREDGSDDEEMVLDPSTGELCKNGDLKRREYRKAILEDIVANDDDDDAEYLDPLTGKMRRKGDKSLSDEEPLTDAEEQEEAEMDESASQPKTSDIPNEDFEELLNPKDSTEGKKPKRPKKNSLAALKLVLTLHKALRIPDPLRNFEVLPAVEDATCLIRFNEYTYELDAIQDTFSVWKCHLSPQYSCRGKVHLTPNNRQISVSGVSHCHVPTLKDMFIDRPAKEDGQIKDTDQDGLREYTFFKRPDHAYQLKLDDGYLYNCITVSKTGVSCWRCVSRQSSSCKAIITMEGEFASMVRNRFSHSHDPVDAAAASAADGNGGATDSSFDSPVVSGKRASSSNDNEDERKKRKRQTL